MKVIGLQNDDLSSLNNGSIKLYKNKKISPYREILLNTSIIIVAKDYPNNVL